MLNHYKEVGFLLPFVLLTLSTFKMVSIRLHKIEKKQIRFVDNLYLHQIIK